MRLTFQLRFHTEFGQSLFLTGNHELLGGGEWAKARALSYVNNEIWEVVLEIESPEVLAGISYNYVLRQPDGELIQDWGRDRKLSFKHLPHKEILILDSWNHAGFFENAFYTEPFKSTLLKVSPVEVQRHPDGTNLTHCFKVKSPLLDKGETVCLLGDCDRMKHWDVTTPILLGREKGDDCFSVALNLTGVSFPLHYKYGVYNLEHRRFVRFEEGANRVLADRKGTQVITLVNDGFTRLPANTWKGAGVAIPVFSLRSQKGFGIGEFADLKLLADWCRKCGLKLIQILPINDTTATGTISDSYPYAAISAFALHPIYLNLEALVTDGQRPLLNELEPERVRLNQLPVLDYEATYKTKLRIVRQVFPTLKEATFQSPAYREFFAENEDWLIPYGVFCHWRETYGTSNFQQWPAHQRYDAEESASLMARDSKAKDEIALHWFIQFHLHLQLQEATAYVHAQGVILKGDIAIGVFRYGADVWQMPELFQMDVQAGAPPDAFGIKGQNWGFPTYNWPRMKATGYHWWKRRFAQMSRYFDAFRIDHILGFFRIWSIPSHAIEGILGYFVPALPIRTQELETRGIRVDLERLLTPYLTEAVLGSYFYEHKEFVKDYFLTGNSTGSYRFKPEFDTQRKIEECFEKWDKTEHNTWLKLGLFEALSNVLLLHPEKAPPGEFHFRFAIESTSSFQNLDRQTQAQLKELYVDYFYRRQEEFWRREALEKLPALKRETNMLVCGEDLGMVPACVPEVMRQLGLLSLELQRMPKDPAQQFFRPAQAPYLSVVTPSTHDMSTIRGWWEEDFGLTQKFYNTELGFPGTAPRTCTGWINKAVVLQHLASPAMWSIFQFQDLLGMSEELRSSNPQAERINVPANPKNYWGYRMHISLERLMLEERFSHELLGYVHEHGR